MPPSGQQNPAAAKTKGPPPTYSAIHKRMLRVMEPNAKGMFKVSDSIRQAWLAGGEEKKNILKLFADCGYSSDWVGKMLQACVTHVGDNILYYICIHNIRHIPGRTCSSASTP